jgi:hypothetical protein
MEYGSIYTSRNRGSQIAQIWTPYHYMHVYVPGILKMIAHIYFKNPYIIHISIWNVSFSILIGQNSVAEWLSG